SIPAPTVVALALVQLAINVAQHEHADSEGSRPVGKIFLQARAGPTLSIEWASQDITPSSIVTHRHVRRRRRWGMGFTRMAADALGGTVLPPAVVSEGRKGVSFGLGSRSLTLPLAHFESGCLTRSTRSWDQEHAGVDEVSLQRLIAEAQANPGYLVSIGFYTARAVPDSRRVWLSLPPEEGTDRVLDVLRGLDHERLLLSAPPPHATRLHALNLLLRGGLGEALPTCYREEWDARFPIACQALGIPTPTLARAPFYPDPQLAAYLLAEIGGQLMIEPNGGVSFRTAEGSGHDWLRLLGANSRSQVDLTVGF
ncbi:MAG: hypothetical protein ACREN8_13885, partial [Candidatus Dormibacteraceae bacterium]